MCVCFSFIKECHPPASGANFGLFETLEPNILFGSAERMFNVKKLDFKVWLSETFRNRVGGGCPLISLWRTHPGYYLFHLSFFPSGDRDTITSLCHAAHFITYCTFLQEERGSAVSGRMAWWWICLGGWGQGSECLGAQNEWIAVRRSD